MMNTRTLTLVQLVKLGACEEQRLKFQALFGDQVEVSVERVSQPDIVGARFDYDWAADAFFTREELQSYYKELRERMTALKKEFGALWLTDVPMERRLSVECQLWAKFYVRAGQLATVPIEQPEIEKTQVTETPAEESLGGY